MGDSNDIILDVLYALFSPLSIDSNTTQPKFTVLVDWGFWYS